MILSISGCTLSEIFGNQQPIDQNQIRTAVAQTIETTLTIGALLESLNKPTLTGTPVPQVVIPTATGQSVIPTMSPSAFLTDTPTTTNIPVPIIASTPVVPLIHSTVNTNCRSGPGSNYDVVGYLMIGDRVEVHGKNTNSTWWYIQNPDDLSKYCWVWNQTTTVEGNKSIIPVITPIATNTPEVAQLTITSKAVPVNYTGACPVNIVLTAKITTNLPVTVDYIWTSDFSYSFTGEEFVFDVAGKQTFTETMVINDSTTGYVRLRITSPYLLKGDRINIVITCSP
jgi:uncharacterized protein YgiM (DUF1202 family)